MTKHLVGARVEELLSKLGVRRCTRGPVVASLIMRVEANHFDARAGHVATVSLAHEVILLVVGYVVLVLALVVLAVAGACCCWKRCCRDTATRECQVESARRRCQRERHRDRIGVFSQAKADGSNPARRASHRVAATRLAGKGFEGRPDQETVAWAWRAGADGRSSSGAVVRQATLGLETGRPRPDRRCWGNRVDH